MGKKVLIITNHRKDRSPGQRFRFEQYLNYLEQNDIHCDWDVLLDENDDAIFFSNNTLGKIFLVIRIFLKRLKTLKRVKDYDIIFIYREAFVVKGAFFEKWIAKRNPSIVLDFDDAIWLENVSKENEKFKWLKKPEKTKTIIQLSKLVITGNDYLAQYARQFNPNSIVIPTTIDTNFHQSTTKQNNGVMTVGWTGSSTTLPYLEQIIPELEKLKQKYGGKINFKIIVDSDKYYPSIDTATTIWSLDTEIEDLNKIDIGLMPLPDTEWAKGKCGFKALQYMSMEIPAIVSAVGVNTQIIQDNVNGLVVKENEWVEKIELLISDAPLREKIGKAGRKTILEKYSVEANKKKYLQAFQNV